MYYRLEEAYGYLLGKAARLAHNALRQRLKEFNITDVQWGILSSVRDNQGASPTDLMELCDRDMPSTLRVLDKLEKKGLIFREYNKTDRRSYMVYLTPEGSALYEQALPVVVKLNEDVMAGVDPAQVTKYINDLKYIIVKYKQYNELQITSIASAVALSNENEKS